MKQKRVLITASGWGHIRSFHLPYIHEFQRRGWEVHVACAGASKTVRCAKPDIDIDEIKHEERMRQVIAAGEGANPSMLEETASVLMIEISFRKSMLSLSNLKAAGQLRKLIRNEHYDLIITHTSLASFFTRLSVKNLKNRPRLINVMHGYLFDDDTPFLKRQLLLNAERLVRKETDLLLTMNEWDYQTAMKYQLGKEIAKIPGMGVDFARMEDSLTGRLSTESGSLQEHGFHRQAESEQEAVAEQKRGAEESKAPEQETTAEQKTEAEQVTAPDQKTATGQSKIMRQLRREYHLPEDAFILIYAAEFSRRKNQQFLINAMRKLPEKTVLILPGDGDLRDEAISLAKSLSLTDRVIFPGQVKDIGTWYHLSDAAVTSSRSEGLPFNVMEAMYTGLPVVASKVKGHTDLIRDGETGLLYPFGDEEAFAQCIQKIMTDDDLRKRIGKQAHENASQYALYRVLPEVMGWYVGFDHEHESDTG